MKSSTSKQTLPVLQRATAQVAGLDFHAMSMLLLHEAAEHGLTVFENTPTMVKIESPHGAFGISIKGGGVELGVEAEDANSLYLIREAVVEHLEHYLPDVAKSLLWSDAPKAGDPPPNFQFATVIKCHDLSKDFIRVTLQPHRPELFSDHSIHFRFVLPAPDNIAPLWPVLKDNGSIKWPGGDKELHRPVYTVTQMLPEQGHILVDIYRHDSGRIMHWAEGAKPGDQIALIGPGGAGTLNDHKVLLCGDETAYPAIARILSNLPSDAQGEVLLLSHSGATDYPFPTHAGVTVRWQTGAGDTFAATAHEVLQSMDSPYLWFAAGAEQVKQTRALTKPMALDKRRSYLGVFWQ